MIEQGDREFLAELALVRAGLKVDPEKAYLIDSRLAPVARREGFGSLPDFVEAVRTRDEERLVWAAVEALALQETAFFRDPAVFEQIASEILPALVRERGGEKVRVWSAACSAGQEAYSIAMILDEVASLGGRVELFASDLSEKALEKAQSGLYSQFEVQRGLPARRLVRHFEKRGELFGLSPRVRQMARWRRVNLLDDLGRDGPFDLILCRYVLGQMAPFAQGKVCENLAGALAPGGRLIVGRGEAQLVRGLSSKAGDPGVFVQGGARSAA
jgi:chemotaxis protein methyltransferase CheR